MKKFLFFGVLLVLTFVFAGCGLGANTRQADERAVQARYASVVGTASEASTIPYLADEVVFEVSLNIFGQQIEDSRTINPGVFLAQFRGLQSNPCTDGSVTEADVKASEVTALNNSISWDAAVVTVDGNEATITRSFTASIGDSTSQLIGKGTTQTFWKKVNTEWKLYKVRHSAVLTLGANQP